MELSVTAEERGICHQLKLIPVAYVQEDDDSLEFVMGDSNNIIMARYCSC